MIDYNLTIKRFFESVAAYLDKCAQNPYDEQDAKNIETSRLKLNAVMANPRQYVQYTVRNDGLFIGQMHGLIRRNKHGYGNNAAFRAFFNVLNVLNRYYKLPMYAQDLLVAIQEWYVASADNVLKNMWYSMVPYTYFAVEQQKTK